MRRGSIALLSIAVALLLGMAPGAALAQAVAVDEDAISYAADVRSLTEGYAEERYSSGVEIACRGEVCRPVNLPGFYGAMPDEPTTFTVPGRLEFTIAPTGGGCDAASTGAVEVVFEFTETTVSGTAVAPETCPGGEGGYAAASMTIDGEIAVGQCHFEPQGCASSSTSSASLRYDTVFEGLGEDSGAIGVACDGATCSLTSFPMAGLTEVAPTFTVPGLLEFSAEAQGGSCDAAPTGPFDVALAFTEAGVSGTVEKLDWSIACEDSELMALGQTVSVSGVLVEGACYFAPTGCGVTSPTATAVPTTQRDPATPSAGETPGSADPGTTSLLSSGDAAAPSVLSALRPPADAGIAPQQLLLAALITVILVLLMAFPTSLLNSAIDGASDKLSEWRERRSAARAAAWTKTWWWAAIGVLLAAVISAFVDPQFGLNPGSLRVVASIAAGFAIDVVLGWVILQWVMRRIAPEATRSYSFKPLSLLIVVGAVVLTRVTGFEPGIVFGLVAGLGFASTLSVAAKARTTLVPVAYALAMGLVAWFVYGFVSERSGESLAMTLLVETLSSLTIGGVVALPLALVPIKGLGGHTVWQASRRLWAASYGIGLLAFFIVLLPMPFSWGEVGWELGAWIGIYVAYALIAVSAWLLVKQPWRTQQTPPAQAPPTVPPVDPPADQEPTPLVTSQ